jgi:uncharacterized Zn-finger protein
MARSQADEPKRMKPVTTPAITITKPERITAPVDVTAQDLHSHGSIACPNDRMPLWSNHPRVMIDLTRRGEGKCPYCGTLYRLRPAVPAPGAQGPATGQGV